MSSYDAHDFSSSRHFTVLPALAGLLPYLGRTRFELYDLQYPISDGSHFSVLVSSFNLASSL